uniref:T-complex protein 1 subunit delta n=1 Tax=Paramoeba aestuarina TaxID=180227 RepID=A0A7S4KYU0_9EUKA|mmetsp:Transcript_28005/g.43418  ORF Transcript_28005/g.43418 Transcript_28005/m.43418 type:complete len:528 (+) Transcript_28005:55-1638(+)
MSNESKQEKEKQTDVRMSNIFAAKSIADCVRTSLGPRGMDKMIQTGTGELIVSNDGATILKTLDVTHPCAKMLVDLSKAQDVDAGDGTTSVVILCGSLLKSCEELLHKGIHPTQIIEGFRHASKLATDHLQSTLAIPVAIDGDKAPLVRAAITSLSSKVVSSNSEVLAPMAVDAIRSIRKLSGEVDLRDIRIVKALGGTVDDTELLENGTVFRQKASTSAGGPKKIVGAKIALVQFQISPPKTDMESSVTVSDYTQIDRAMKEERKYILDICRKIQKSGCNVLLLQKSILRDAVTTLSLDILAKMNIMVVTDIERAEVPFIAKCFGLLPISHIDHLSPEKLGHADLVSQETSFDGSIIRVNGIRRPDGASSNTATVLVRGGNQYIIDETERSFHDALCVVRSIAKKGALIPGGSAAEIEVALHVSEKSRDASGVIGYCMRAFADAFEIIPYTLAENAGLNPIAMVTQLRQAHREGRKSYGIDVRRGEIADMVAQDVVQPFLVTLSAIRLATECVSMILKIDDIVVTK